MVTGCCPFFKKVKTLEISSAQCYCSGYASGKLRIPVLYEEIFFCNHDEKFKDCNTYQFSDETKVVIKEINY